MTGDKIACATPPALPANGNLFPFPNASTRYGESCASRLLSSKTMFHTTSRKTLLLIAVSLIVPLLILAEVTETVDLQVVHKIKRAVIGAGAGADGFGGGGGRGGGGAVARSSVMTTMYNLTDRYGP